MLTFSVKLEKWSFHVADLPRIGKKCTKLKKAREGRAKLLFLSIKRKPSENKKRLAHDEKSYCKKRGGIFFLKDLF